ncbi:MAG: hypothetical protein AABZ34_04280 [Nitrospirota bacterium]
MKNDQQLGLDELMIVNPGSSGAEVMFLGEDGTLYQVQGLGEEAVPHGPGQFVLGEDGTLYQTQGLSSNGVGEAEAQELGRYFLGEDGTLYEVVTK